MRCPECDGTGEVQEGEAILECDLCEGTGEWDMDE